jgi:alpha-ribazole phosphatase
MKLWLLRHAKVTCDPGLCYGASDVPADLALTRAAAEAAAALLPVGLSVWVSALGRARQLADALHTLRPDLAPTVIDPRLNEMDFGCWELQPWDGIPRVAFDAWLADFAHARFGGVESTQQVIDRVADALDAQRKQAADRAVEEAVWITHAGVIRAVQYTLAHGRAPIRDVSQWPRDAPQPGGWMALSL